MSYQWTTLEEGIRVRYHPTRKHGIKPDVYYTIRQQIDGKRVEESLGWASGGMTLAKARAELAKLKEAARLGTGPLTLKEKRAEQKAAKAEEERTAQMAAKATVSILDFWEKSYFASAQQQKKVSSVKTEEQLFRNWICPAIGETSLQKLTPVHVEGIIGNILKAGRAPRTAQYAIAVISQIWNAAYIHGIVSGENPARRVKKPRIDNRRTRFLSNQEASLLLNEIKKRSQDLYDTCLLSLFCGLRAGEIHNLQWSDVDLNEKLIFIKDPKSGHNRHAYMTDEVLKMFQTRYAGQDKTAFVFPTADGKKRAQISDSFERSVNALGLNDGLEDRRQRVVFHTLRHTFASWFVQKGKPLYIVAELMGHRTIQMTQRYSHLEPDTVRKTAMSLQGVLNETNSDTAIAFPQLTVGDVAS